MSKHSSGVPFTDRILFEKGLVTDSSLHVTAEQHPGNHKNLYLRPKAQTIMVDIYDYSRRFQKWRNI